jgi:hypothetical protein
MFLGLQGPPGAECQAFVGRGALGIVHYPIHTDGGVSVEKDGETEFWWFPVDFFFDRALLIPDLDRPDQIRKPDWWYASIPLWPLVLIVDTLAVRAVWRSRGRRPHMCPQCRYSRIGLNLGAPCPECGWLPVVHEEARLGDPNR